jgi:hypothetical protein
MWRQRAIGIAAAVALLPQQGVALAQSFDISANAMMPGCRDLMNASERNGVGQAECLGIVRTMHYFARYYFGECRPERVTVGQTLRVVVTHIDQRPGLIHERFEDLALEAILEAWPCRK